MTMPLEALVARFGLQVLGNPSPADLQRHAQWVALCDGPAELWKGQPRSGDLVVTSADWIGSAAEASSFVSRVGRRRLAGICLLHGCSQRRADWIAAAADSAGVVVLALPIDLDSRQLAIEMTSLQIRIDAAKAYRVTSGLVDLTDALAMNGIPGVVTTLAQLTGGWATLVDKYGKLITTVGAGRVHVDDAISAATSGPRRQRNPNLTVFPVGRSDAPKARLVVAAHPQRNDEARELALHAARLIDLGYFPPAGSDVWPLARRDAVEALLTGHPIAASIAERWALRGDEFLVSVLRSRSRAVLLEEAALSWLSDLSLPPVVAGDGPDVIVIVSADAGQDWQTAVVRASDSGVPLRCGIGDARPLSELRLSHSQARQSLEIAIADSRPVVKFTELGTMKILLAGLGADGLAALTEPLRTITDADAGEGVYLTSLRVFLAENGNWEAASSQLQIHRHTLRHRIARVQSLTGLDMSRADDRFRAWVALRALDASSEI